MSTRWTGFLGVALCGALAWGSSGCAEMLAQGAKDAYIQQQVTETPIPKPLEDVWGATKLVIAEEGWAIARADDGAHTLRSADRPNSSCSGPGSKMWLEVAASQMQQGVALNIRQFVDCRKADGSAGLNLESRLWTTELAVLKKVDPQRAGEIEAEGERRKQAQLKK